MEQSLWESTWNSDMAFGIPELDDEHRSLVARINDLNHAIAMGLEPDKLELLLTQIFEEALVHFTHEESVLAQAKYPLLKGHALLHERLKAELENVTHQCHCLEDLNLWAEYGLLVRQLFCDHLLDEVKRYSEFHRV